VRCGQAVGRSALDGPWVPGDLLKSPVLAILGYSSIFPSQVVRLLGQDEPECSPRTCPEGSRPSSLQPQSRECICVIIAPFSTPAPLGPPAPQESDRLPDFSPSSACHTCSHSIPLRLPRSPPPGPAAGWTGTPSWRGRRGGTGGRSSSTATSSPSSGSRSTSSPSGRPPPRSLPFPLPPQHLPTSLPPQHPYPPPYLPRYPAVPSMVYRRTECSPRPDKPIDPPCSRS